MILDDKPYIKPPKNKAPLMHYLGLTQLISIFKNKSLYFSTCELYPDQREGTLTDPSRKETFKNLLWEDNTPVKKCDGYTKYKKDFVEKYKDQYEGERKFTDCWTDSFEYLIWDFVRYFMFTHCWSLSDHENILMWDRYRFHQPTLAIKTTLERIQEATNVPMYIGEINYVDYENEHITRYERFTEKNLTEKETIEELFYQPFFHKQKCYKNENEVRLIICYETATKYFTEETYIIDIPFYNYNALSYKHFGFDTNSFFRGKSTDPKRFTKEDGKDIDIPQNALVEINPNVLVEQIIISPYAENYILSIIRDIAERYDFDPKKIVDSPINIKT